MTIDRSIPRAAGDKMIVAQARRQVQTFFDELKNGTQNYRTIASLNEQIVQAYRGGAFWSCCKTPTMLWLTRQMMVPSRYVLYCVPRRSPFS